MSRRWASLILATASFLLSGNIVLGEDLDISRAFSTAQSSSKISIDHSEWSALLTRYVHEDASGINRFAYGAVTPADHALLKHYLARLQKIDPGKLSADEQHAFWINLYNAVTVDVVLDHYPVKSIRDISSGLFSFGPWDLPLVTVDGHPLTLNNIEHDILRKSWRDPRVHYALNCASLGCPNLAPVPYSGHSLDAELDAAARSFVNHPRAVSLHNGHLILSQIYQWYAKDFGGGSPAAVIAHIRRYAKPALSVQLANQADIDGYEYDWQLNAPGMHFTPPQ
jgi:hypothetical protein